MARLRPPPGCGRDRRPVCDAVAAARRSQGQGGWVWRNGNQPNAALRSERAPAPTIDFGHRANQVEWVPGVYDTRQCGARPRPVSEPSPTMLASGLAKGVPLWAAHRPATTVACDRRVHPPGHKQNASDPPGRYEQRRGANAVRVTTTQAAVLQGFDPRYPWRGPRTRQFEQIGNAVPPPLALAVLAEAVRASDQRPRPSDEDPPPRAQGPARRSRHLTPVTQATERRCDHSPREPCRGPFCGAACRAVCGPFRGPARCPRRRAICPCVRGGYSCAAGCDISMPAGDCP